MKKKVMKESTAWQIGAHTVMIIGSLLAILPFILLVIASFTDNQTALVNGYSFTPEKWSLEAYQYIASEWATIGRAYLMTILVTVIGTALSLVITSTFAFAVSNDKLPGHKILMFLCIFTMLFNGGLVASYYVYSNIFHIKNTIWALIVPTFLMSPFNVVLVKKLFFQQHQPQYSGGVRMDGARSFRGVYEDCYAPFCADHGDGGPDDGHWLLERLDQRSLLPDGKRRCPVLHDPAGTEPDQ